MKLQKQYDALKNHPECSICVHRVGIINEGRTTEETFPLDGSLSRVVKKEEILDQIWFEKIYFPFATSSYFFQKIIYEDFYKADFDMNGDAQYMLFAPLHGDFYYINDIMGFYRRNALGSYNRTAKYSKKEDFIKKRSYVKALCEFNQYSHGKFERWLLKELVGGVMLGDLFENDEGKELLKGISLKDVFVNCGFVWGNMYSVWKISPFYFQKGRYLVKKILKR